MFESQRKFEEGFGKYDKIDRIKNTFFALIVEQGEAANECPQTFKFWSSNPKGSSLKQAERYAKLYNQPVILDENDVLLEELVDQLHFILSLGNELEFSQYMNSYGHITNGNIVDMQMHFTKCIIDLYFYWRDNSKSTDALRLAISNYNLMAGYFFGIAYELGYSSGILESAYYEKDRINHQRQQNRY
jgi:dimeric dUTPase (all-alpha-NTP-PPase superfamily)